MWVVPGDGLDSSCLATVVLCLTGETFWDLDAKEIAEESVSLHSKNDQTQRRQVYRRTSESLE